MALYALTLQRHVRFLNLYAFTTVLRDARFHFFLQHRPPPVETLHVSFRAGEPVHRVHGVALERSVDQRTERTRTVAVRVLGLAKRRAVSDHIVQRAEHVSAEATATDGVAAKPFGAACLLRERAVLAEALGRVLRLSEREAVVHVHEVATLGGTQR